MPLRAVRKLAVAAALGLVIAGQWRFSFEPKSLAAGAWLWLAGVALAVLACGKRPFTELLGLDPATEPPASPPTGSAERTATRGEWIVRAALVVFGLTTGVAVVVAVERSSGNHWPIFAAWVVALVSYALAFARRGRALGDDRTASSRAAILGLFVIAFALRAFDLESMPWSLGGDEASQGLEARNFLDGARADVFGLGWLSVPNLSFVWTALWLGIAGDDTTGLRLAWAIVGTLGLPGFYLLASRLFDRETAIVSTALLAGYHFHLHYSRLGSCQIGDPFFAAWGLYLLVTGVERSSRPRWVAAAIVSAVAFYGYAGGRQVPILLGGALVAFAVSEPHRLRGQLGHAFAALGAFAIGIGPIALVAIRHPSDFDARINQMGIIQSGWLERTAAETGRSIVSLLLQQFERAFLAFNFYPDHVAWYGPPIPLMDFSWSILFGLGAFLCAARLGSWRAAIPLGWFVAVVGLGGALTENPPSSMRLVGAAAPAVLCVAVAIRFLAIELAPVLRHAALARRAVVGLVAAGLIATSLHFYFVTYQRSWRYGWVNTEVATRLGYYLRDLGPGWTEYFFGAPRMYARFPTTEFLARETELTDVLEPLTGEPSFVDPTRRAIFVFLPERRRELDHVRRAFPNGRLDTVRRFGTINGPVLFFAYRPEGSSPTGHEPPPEP